MKIYIQKPVIGSKFYYGNFTLGIAVDSHPRFKTLLLCFVFFEVVIELKSPSLNQNGFNTPKDKETK